MTKIRRHKVFISFHEEDSRYRDALTKRLKQDIIDKSVHMGAIDDRSRNLKVDTIRRRIREEFIADATVTIVLVGPKTWQRKDVDWEIAASLRHTKSNPRCGLLGIVLPNHPDTRPGYLRGELMPARLYDNACPEVGYATMHRWASLSGTRELRWWINQAFERRTKILPRNRRRLRGRNSPSRAGPGWTSSGSTARVYATPRHFRRQLPAAQRAQTKKKKKRRFTGGR